MRSDASTGTPALQTSPGRLVLRGHSASLPQWPAALSTVTRLHVAPNSQGRRPTVFRCLVMTRHVPRSGPNSPSPSTPSWQVHPRGLWALLPTRVQGRDTAAIAPSGLHPTTSWKDTLQPCNRAPCPCCRPPPTLLPSTQCRGQMVVLLKPRADPARPLFKAPQSHPEETKSKTLQSPAGLTRPELPDRLLPTRGLTLATWPSVALTCPAPHL